MKYVITLHQPWAYLMTIGAKVFETRGWKPSAEMRANIAAGGGTLLIHSSAKMSKAAFELCKLDHFKKYVPDISALDYGKVVGSVDLLKVYTTEEMQKVLSEWPDRNRAIEEWQFGDYGPGRYAWETMNPKKFDHPFMAKGSLSIWTMGEAYYEQFYKG